MHACNNNPLWFFFSILLRLACCAYDLPLKQCPGNQIADPSWMNGQAYGWAKGSNYFDWNTDTSPCASCNFEFVVPTEISNDLKPKATLYSPYSYIAPWTITQMNAAGIRKWSVTADAGSPGSSIFVETMIISQNRTTCMKPASPLDPRRPYQMLSSYDAIASGTFVGDRHVLIATDAGQQGGSGIGRVLLIDYRHFGTQGDCSGSSTTAKHPSIFQIYPVMEWQADRKLWVEKANQKRQLAFHGCHVDSYANDAMASIRSTTQPFYIACMSTSDGATLFLHAFKLDLLNSLDDRVSMSDDSSYFRVQEWAAASTFSSSNMPAVSILSYPVHVVGKRLVLYRCFMQNTVMNGRAAAGDAHWCWRNVDSGLWGAENPALTTAVLEAGVLQKGMFLGWSGSEENALPGTKKLYFLDRSARRLYTLGVSDDLNTVLANRLTGILSDAATSSITESVMHYPLIHPEKLPLYGQVNHYYDISAGSTATYRPVDEILYVVQQMENFRHAFSFFCTHCIW